MDKWTEAQRWEAEWWNSCHNTYGEETKQLLYASRMGLRAFHDGRSPYNFDLGGATVLDIGGGPTSLLLKCVNYDNAVVLDPISFPGWVLDRYAVAGIDFVHLAAEDYSYPGSRHDECWIYNTLQHVRNPERVVRVARRVSHLIRIFEWLETPVNAGHLHSLTEAELNEWLGGEGKVEQMTGQATCKGLAYYGVFPT